MLLEVGIGWVIYFTLHSFLAANITKEKCKMYFPFVYLHYRILYNLIAVAGLLPLIWLSLLDGIYLSHPSPLLKILGILLILFGVLMLGIAFASFNVKEFIGLENPAHAQDEKLVTSGVYRYVRHPLYTAMLLLFPGVFLYRPTASILILVIIAIVYIEIGSRLEEKKLIQFFGDDYIRYQQRVKRYFPFVY